MQPVDHETLARQLKPVLGERLTDNETVCAQHGRDEGYHALGNPKLVAFPESTQEVRQIVMGCAAAGCPVVAWGAGTSLEGNALPLDGGLCVDFARMNRIIAVNPEDRRASVQAGVRRLQLNKHLRDTGMFFPIDPGADATLGGMTATRASGTCAVRYGTMRENVLTCTVVLADGTAMRTRSAAPKSAAGYDVTSLFIGSEGTLGLITEIDVRLHPIPEYAITVLCTFPTIRNAIDASTMTIAAGLRVARIELLDERMISAINRHEWSSYPELPTLFMEFHGSRAEVDHVQDNFLQICADANGRVQAAASTTEAQREIWKARHNALYATKALRPGHRVLITDVCVPISRLADCLETSRQILHESGLVSTIAGHVGDGNFHAFICVDPLNQSETDEAERIHHRLARIAIAMDGTCTGEHGIGVGKRTLLREELPEVVSAMQAIKHAFDPRGILNPGKLFSES